MACLMIYGSGLCFDGTHASLGTSMDSFWFPFETAKRKGQPQKEGEPHTCTSKEPPQGLDPGGGGPVSFAGAGGHEFREALPTAADGGRLKWQLPPFEGVKRGPEGSQLTLSW